MAITFYKNSEHNLKKALREYAAEGNLSPYELLKFMGSDHVLKYKILNVY